MRRVLLSMTISAFVVAAGVQSAAGSNVSATHAYIQANYALAKAAVARIASVQAKAEALNTSLAQQCPLAGQGAPVLEVSQPVSHEVVAALWALAYTTNAPPIATFVSKTKHLRWSSSRITHILTRYARSLHEMATLPQPPICEDVRAFAASGFKTPPARAVALVEHVEAIELEPIPPHLLAPYERGSDANVLGKTKALEEKLEEQEFNLGQTDWLQILGTLGLPQ